MPSMILLNHMTTTKIFFLTAFIIIAFFYISRLSLASSSFIFSEIMYDLAGTDDKHEWVELHNTGIESIDLTDFTITNKIDDSKHGINIPPKNGGSGSMVVPAGGYIVLADDATTFLVDYPGFAGSVFDTIIKLNNTEASFSLFDKEDNIVISIKYTSDMGASGNGNSLSYFEGSEFAPVIPTPGYKNERNIIEVPEEKEEITDESIQTENVASDDIADLEEENKEEVATSNKSSSNSTNKAKITKKVISKPKILSKDSAPSESNILFTLSSGDSKKDGKYVWNFGDGVSKEVFDTLGVEHIYEYPGEYIVFVERYEDSISKEPKMSLRKKINVFAINLKVELLEDKTGIILKNTTSKEVDLSNFVIMADRRAFILPKNTFILANKKITFSNKTLGVNLPINYIQIISPEGKQVAIYETPIPKQNKIVQKTVPLEKKKEVAVVEKVEAHSATSTKNIPNLVLLDKPIENTKSVDAPIVPKKPKFIKNLASVLSSLL